MQANKIKSISERWFCEGNIGESGKIKIPNVDRARSDLRSILAEIVSGIISNNIFIIIYYQLGMFISNLNIFYRERQKL